MKHTPDQTKHETRDTMRWHLPRTAGMEHFRAVELVLTLESHMGSTFVRIDLMADMTVNLVSISYVFPEGHRP